MDEMVHDFWDLLLLSKVGMVKQDRIWVMELSLPSLCISEIL
jgi:hypothetical protein